MLSKKNFLTFLDSIFSYSSIKLIDLMIDTIIAVFALGNLISAQILFYEAEFA